MVRAGERAWNLKRVINNRLGLQSSCDKLPRPLLNPYSNYGEDASGFVPDIQGMLSAYYAVRSWDPATGFPTQNKLSELGLSWACDDLWPTEMSLPGKDSSNR